VDAIAIFESEFGITLEHASGNEWCGPCPFCVPGKVTGVDRLRVWVGEGQEGIGSYWCRQCERKGFVDKLLGGAPLTDHERRLRRLEAEAERVRRKEREIEQRLSALERLNRRDDHKQYYRALDENDRAWWHSQGIVDATIDAHELGVCYGCPMDYPDHRPSYTIPVYASDRTTLLNIRHRLIGPVDGDRYRPHMKDLPGKALFNAHYAVTENEILVLEGSKKALCIEQYGYPATGVFGMHGFDLSWLKRFKARRLMLCPDPDAMRQWSTLGHDIAKEGFTVHVAEFPVKPDDLFIDGGTAADFERYLRWARRIH
jgi:hypothetical protein